MTLGWLVLLALAHADTVELDGARYARLLHEEVAPAPDLPGPTAVTREVELAAVEGGLAVRARWTIRALEPGWFRGVLVGPEAHVERVTWNGVEAAVHGDLLVGWVEDVVVVELVGFVAGDRVRLMPALRGVVDGVEVEGALWDGRRQLHPGEDLVRSTEPPRADRSTVVLARAGLGLTIGDAEVVGRAHVAWEVRRGRVATVALRVSGLGADLALNGPNVESWRREGDRLLVVLREPAEDRVDVHLAWSTATPRGTEATLSLPVVQPVDVFRAEASVQVAREEGIEVVPSMPGWQAIASGAVPDWGRDLVQGRPVASFLGQGGGALDLLRFAPVALPPVIVDVAVHRVAVTAEGRVLARAFYEVRNERAPTLRVRAPDGWRILGVRVSGETARPVTDGEGGWLIPLPRSVETVEGLISFGVEVAFLGQGAAFDVAESRALPMPTVDAEIASWRATLFLPQGWRNRLDPGQGHAVDRFDDGEGIPYGFGLRGTGAAQADALFEEALSSWLSNEFDKADRALEELRSLGAQGEKIDLLQSNLDLVQGKRDDGGYLSRKVRAEARARASGAELAQQELERKAKELERRGDLQGASGYYEAALQVGSTLEQLEGSESVDVRTKNVAYRDKLEELEEEQAQRVEVLGEAAALPWDVEGEVDWDVEGEPDWDVEGEPSWGQEFTSDGITVSGRGYGAAGAGASGVALSGEAVAAPEPASANRPMVYEESGRGFRIRLGGRRRSATPEALPPPEVVASALSITIPAVGEAVRYQRRLVPSGVVAPLIIDAKATCKERRRR